MPTINAYSTKTFLQVFVFICLALLMAPSLLAATLNGRWQPGIGDPTMFGWITTIFYGLVFVRFVVLAKTSSQEGGGRQLWLVLAAIILFLGINKQLDLQTWLTQTLKDSAVEHGWYGQRRVVQIAFIAVLGVGMIITLVTLRFFLVNAWRRHKLLWLGLLLLCVFILIRAASFHHVDVLIATSWMGVKVNVLLEMGALLLMLMGTFVKHKVSSFQTVKLSEINPIVAIEREGDVARCPQCGKQAVAMTLHERKFKCRRCGFIYRIHVTHQPV